ncbi:MAG: hypothetical protein Q7R33_09725 [Nitrosarchaeum sp.]|nr:hypothetical protein [Nitrosarchaeum sp.]
MANDYGTTVSRTLPVDDRSFDTIVWQQGKPPLDSELNLVFDVMSEKLQRYIKNQTSSGFLSFNDFEFDPTWINKFKTGEMFAVVDGQQISVNPNGNGYINLSPATVGLGNHRYDFVFLEVWKVLLIGDTTSHKPSASTIYNKGNVQDTFTTLPDDIVDPVIVATTPETTRRVQLQYRIRIQEDIGTPTQQNSNIFDAVTFGQGGTGTPVNPYSFTNLGTTIGDYGLWRAGNGDVISRTQLQTIDGYTYAIPIAIVFRRSQDVYNDEDLDGQLAASIAIGGTSDRIDGLFYDSVAVTDIMDLRHQVLTGSLSYDEILKLAIQDLLTGNNAVRRPISIQYDAMFDVAITGYSILGNCNRTRTTWSDLQTTTVSNVARLTVADTDNTKDFYVIKIAPPTTWNVGDQIVVKAPHGSPTGTIILGTDDATVGTKPYVYQNAIGLTDVAGSWSGTGTATATFTFNTSFSNVDIWITYDIQYPNNQGLTHTVEQLLKLEYVNATSFPTVQNPYFPHSGIIRAGTNLLNSSIALSRNSKQIDYLHTGSPNSFAANYTLNSRNKELQLTPVISSTTTVGGSTRTLYTRNFKSADLKLYLPFATDRTWFIRGVYTGQSSGTEVAMTTYASETPSLISGNVAKHPTASGQSFASISSFIYIPTSTELIGTYQPVFRQSTSGDVNLFLLVDGSGNVLSLPSPVAADYSITHKSIATVKVNAYASNDNDPKNNWVQIRSGTGVIDAQQLWIDLDYIGEPHDGAEIKVIYEHSQYQGLIETSGLQLSAKLKAMQGLLHTDGTGNVTANIDPIKYPQPLIMNLPTPDAFEYLVKGDSVAGVGNRGKYISTDVCYTVGEILDYSTATILPLKLNDVVTGKFNIGLNSVERGGNDATTDKSLMLLPLSVANYKQVVIFGLAITQSNFAMKNELVLFVWTYTNNDAANQLASSDALHIGVDFFFIKKRPLIRIE